MFRRIKKLMGNRRNDVVPPGELAPGFELPELDGGTRTLRDLIAGAPVLLAFYKASCPVCQLTFPYLERLYAKGAGLRVFAVSQDDPETTRGFRERFGVTFPTLLDTAKSGYPVSNAYGISHVPSLFLIGPDGTVSESIEGFQKKAMERLGQTVNVAPFLAHEAVPEWKAG